MIKKEKLYDAFGELIYAIALADGEIQESEIAALNKYLQNHPFAKEIKWSFDYEKAKNHDIETAYQNAIDTCKENGPDPEYKYLLEILVGVAEAFAGIVPEERKIIERFQDDLAKRFEKDLRENKLAFVDED